jgi:hypothetical protein
VSSGDIKNYQSERLSSDDYQKKVPVIPLAGKKGVELVRDMFRAAAERGCLVFCVVDVNVTAAPIRLAGRC